MVQPGGRGALEVGLGSMFELGKEKPALAQISCPALVLPLLHMFVLDLPLLF